MTEVFLIEAKAQFNRTVYICVYSVAGEICTRTVNVKKEAIVYSKRELENSLIWAKGFARKNKFIKDLCIIPIVEKKLIKNYDY